MATRRVGFSPLRRSPAITARFRVLVLPLLLAVFSSPTHSQTPQAVQETKDYEQFLAYWTTEASWHSELQLKNNQIDRDLTVVPVLRTPDGAETSLPAVTVKPQEVQLVDIGALAPQLRQTYGSVVLRHHSSGSRGLYAAVMIHDMGHPIAFHLDATDAFQGADPGSREGIWWLPKDTTNDYLVLTNQGNNPMHLALSIYDMSGKEIRQRLELGPRQTSRYSVRQLVRSAGLTGSYGGIKIYAGAKAASLDTVHFLFDEQAGFSAILKMFDHEPNAKIEKRDLTRTGVWTLRAPMLALSQPDSALGFPDGAVLQPQVFIRNTTGNPVVASLRFNWRSDSTTGNAPGPTVRLAPFETRRIDVAALQDGKTLPKEAHWAAVILTTKGIPDEVMAVAASYDESLRYGAQTPFNDQLSFRWEGGMWEYDVQHDSVITVGNGGSKPARAAFTIFYNQGKEQYELEQTLQPDSQMWIQVGKLIREQLPDKNGKMLPPDLTSGSYEIRDLSNPGTGRLFEGKVIYDKTYGNVAYGCAGQCCYVGARLVSDPLGIPFLGTTTNGVNGNDNCGFLDNVSSDFWGNWNTANHSIATVNTYGTHTGAAAGSTTSSTHGQLLSPYGRYYCTNQTYTPGGGDNVVGLSCTASVTRGGTTTCTVTGPAGTTASGWKFTAGSTAVNRGTNTSLTWSGVMGASGTVSVTASAGVPVTLSTNITVTTRNWHTSPAAAAEVPNGTFYTLPVPPQSTGLDAGVGESQEIVQNNGFSSTFISDGGPNNGFGYYATKPTFTTTYKYEINPDLENTSSTFYTKQCGNYNATTKPSGFISGSNLLTQTRRHEYNSTTQSHHAFYSNSISGANNPGDYVESRVATPGTSQTTFDSTTGTTLNDPSGGNGYYQKIYKDFSVEPLE